MKKVYLVYNPDMSRGLMGVFSSKIEASLFIQDDIDNRDNCRIYDVELNKEFDISKIDNWLLYAG